MNRRLLRAIRRNAWGCLRCVISRDPMKGRRLNVAVFSSAERAAEAVARFRSAGLIVLGVR